MNPKPPADIQALLPVEQIVSRRHLQRRIDFLTTLAFVGWIAAVIFFTSFVTVCVIRWH